MVNTASAIESMIRSTNRGISDLMNFIVHFLLLNSRLRYPNVTLRYISIIIKSMHGSIQKLLFGKSASTYVWSAENNGTQCAYFIVISIQRRWHKFALIYDTHELGKPFKMVLSVHKRRETAERVLEERMGRLGKKVTDCNTRIVWLKEKVKPGFGVTEKAFSTWRPGEEIPYGETNSDSDWRKAQSICICLIPGSCICSPLIEHIVVYMAGGAPMNRQTK